MRFSTATGRRDVHGETNPRALVVPRAMVRAVVGALVRRAGFLAVLVSACLLTNAAVALADPPPAFTQVARRS